MRETVDFITYPYRYDRIRNPSYRVDLSVLQALKFLLQTALLRRLINLRCSYKMGHQNFIIDSFTSRGISNQNTLMLTRFEMPRYVFTFMTYQLCHGVLRVLFSVPCARHININSIVNRQPVNATDNLTYLANRQTREV